MEVHALGWIALGALIVVMITIDIVATSVTRTPHLEGGGLVVGGLRGMAIVFGFVVWAVYGGQYGTEYFAGYVTEKSLSVDNLFVFVIIIAAFKIPRKYQQEVLLARAPWSSSCSPR
ncbi:hypothetical protein [Georgenia sp. SUBG003]|uniref:hypothetical protein n=1 Tax=Georgenia sp. SUBG003 TaxID=1497974 RepID=UPI003AB8FC68